MQCVNEPEQTICYRKKQTTGNLSSSFIYPVIDFEFRHNKIIVKVGRFSCKCLTLG